MSQSSLSDKYEWLTRRSWSVSPSRTLDPLLIEIPTSLRTLEQHSHNEGGCPEFVRVLEPPGRNGPVLRVIDSPYPGAMEREIGIASALLSPATTSVHLAPATLKEFRFWRAFHRPDGRFDIAITCSTLLTAVLAGWLAVDRFNVFTVLTNTGRTIVQICAVIFALLATGLSFAKTFWVAAPRK